MGIAASLNAVAGNCFIVKTLQYRAELFVSNKVMGYINAFLVSINGPQNARNNKEKFSANFSIGKKVFSFFKMFSLKIRGNDCFVIACYGSE
jgi:hypothetical protein